MAAYQCPVCGQQGIYHHGDDFYEWAESYFGPFHTHESHDLLPMPCHEHFEEAGRPCTHEHFQTWLSPRVVKKVGSEIPRRRRRLMRRP